jgi:1-acyl-sn-glycerol-3-phosphate acyltransferase
LKLRGYLTLGVIGFGLIVGDPIQRTVVAGLARLFPSRRTAILTRWIRLYAHLVLGSARTFGGARIQHPPSIPGEAGVLVLMNHQSVLDIPTVVESLTVYPRIVTRARYASGKPLISHMIRLYQYPVVEPSATARRQFDQLAEVGRESTVPVAIYPEGTRTRDGRIGAWREGGLRAILGARRWKVYILVADGFWQVARLPDFVRNVGTIDSRSAVFGPFQGPEPGADPEPFIAEMRARMEAGVAGLRAGASGK